MVGVSSGRSFEESAADVQELIKELQRCDSIGVAILDDELRYRAVNPALAQMNGLPEVDHLGKTVAEVLGELEHQVSPLVREVLATGRPLLHCDLSGTTPTRRELGHWIGHYFPLKDQSGRTVQLGAVVFEVTRQRKVESLLATLTGRTEVDPTLKAVERDYIIHVLKKVHGKVAGQDGAAAKLGMKRTTLQSKLYKLGINARDYSRR